MSMKFSNSKSSLSLTVLMSAILALALFLFFITPSRIEEPGFTTPTEEYTVLEVTDGDTIVILINGRRDSVRLIGIDTPEIAGPHTEEECFGPEASERTKELTRNQRVKLLPDTLSQNRDKYQRLLRYVYLDDGTLLNQVLLEDGYARLFPFLVFEMKAEFVNLENQAKENQRGLWSMCNN